MTSGRKELRDETRDATVKKRRNEVVNRVAAATSGRRCDEGTFGAFIFPPLFVLNVSLFLFLSISGKKTHLLCSSDLFGNS